MACSSFASLSQVFVDFCNESLDGCAFLGRQIALLVLAEHHEQSSKAVDFEVAVSDSGATALSLRRIRGEPDLSQAARSSHDGRPLGVLQDAQLKPSLVFVVQAEAVPVCLERIEQHEVEQ